MKRVLLIFLSLSLLTLPAPVQGGGFTPKNLIRAMHTRARNFRPKKRSTYTPAGSAAGKRNHTPRVTANTSRNLRPRHVDHILDRRLRNSFKKAMEIQDENPLYLSFLGEPVRRVHKTKKMPSQTIYRNKPFLTTSPQTAKYMAAQSNRLFMQESLRIREWIEQLKQHIPQMEEAARNTPHPEEPIVWLAQQLPTETTMLFVGEMHGFADIREGVETLLTTLRQRDRNREIILFTEFLPKGSRWSGEVIGHPLALPDYIPVWEKAAHNHIEVIGLEPEIVLNDVCEVEGIDPRGLVKNFSQWTHLEGMRLRNESWMETLQAQRQMHPDALFIVYTGSAHSAYYFPFSLSTALLGKEKPFVATLYPDQLLREDGRATSEASFIRHKEPLESLTKHILFQQPFLQFKDPALARLAGFDVRIKVPINIRRHAIENGF